LPSQPDQAIFSRPFLQVSNAEVTVRHTGYTDPALRERKLQRDCKILEAELAERPDDPFVLFNLGSIAVERQDWSSALGHLQRSLRGSAPTDSIVRKLFALITRCHQMLGDLPAALNACSEGLRLGPDDAELHFRKARPPSQGGPAGRGRSLLAADLDPQASRPVLQRRPGHLRPPDPA